MTFSSRGGVQLAGGWQGRSQKPFEAEQRRKTNAFGFFETLDEHRFGEVGERRIKGATRLTPVRPIAQHRDVK